MVQTARSLHVRETMSHGVDHQAYRLNELVTNVEFDASPEIVTTSLGVTKGGRAIVHHR